MVRFSFMDVAWTADDELRLQREGAGRPAGNLAEVMRGAACDERGSGVMSDSHVAVDRLQRGPRHSEVGRGGVLRLLLSVRPRLHHRRCYVAFVPADYATTDDRNKAQVNPAAIERIAAAAERG